MKQNIYDNPDFFVGYKAMRDSNSGLNEILEQPAIKSLLPDLRNKIILELGCGAGGFCRYLVHKGAKQVVGIDISNKMLEIARQENSDARISYFESPIENFESDITDFDIVVSSLAFHYIADLDELFARINAHLRPNGVLIFSIEHPIATCSQGIHPGWQRDDSGAKRFWQVDEYSKEGMRQSRWIVDGVIKYHRQLSSIINSLIDNGFLIGRVLEPHAIEEAENEKPSLLEERRRPPFLIVKSTKKRNTEQSHAPDVDSAALH